MLTFFFTGVPPLEEETNKVKTGDKEGPEQLKVEEKRQQKNRVAQDQPKVFVHGPYGAGQCYQCHDQAGTIGFRPVRGQRLRALSGKGGTRIRGRLRAPAEELCLPCHIYKTESIARARDMWLHGPVAQGKCIWCHSPHSTPYRYMLLKKDSRELCQQCHEEKLLKITPAHQNQPGEAECLSCHNPHMGKSRFLLRAGYDEAF